MARFAAAVGFASLLLPFAALAQTATFLPTPQPTPPPASVAMTDAPDPELRAIDTLPPEMLRRPGKSSWKVVPTLAIAAGAHTTTRAETGERTSSVDVWLGARFHPFTGFAGPFVAAGAEINLRNHLRPGNAPLPRERVTYLELVPEMRWGFAFLPKPYEAYRNTVIPNLEIYGIAGWRIANRYNDNALRVGAGISAPGLMGPIPGMFEVTMDVDSAKSGVGEYAFRIGWHF